MLLKYLVRMCSVGGGRLSRNQHEKVSLSQLIFERRAIQTLLDFFLCVCVSHDGKYRSRWMPKIWARFCHFLLILSIPTNLSGIFLHFFPQPLNVGCRFRFLPGNPLLYNRGFILNSLSVTNILPCFFLQVTIPSQANPL
jgi:hypothetical protein